MAAHQLFTKRWQVFTSSSWGPVKAYRVLLRYLLFLASLVISSRPTRTDYVASHSQNNKIQHSVSPLHQKLELVGCSGQRCLLRESIETLSRVYFQLKPSHTNKRNRICISIAFRCDYFVNLSLKFFYVRKIFITFIHILNTFSRQ